MKKQPKLNRTGKWLVNILLVFALSLCGMASWFFISNSKLPSDSTLSDQAALLFGASSIALIMISMLVAVLALFGWSSLQNSINDKVESLVSERVSGMQNEMLGRLLSGMGYMIGEVSSRRDSFEPLDRDRLEHAVALCRAGYSLLEKNEGPAKYMGLNNLIYYSCLYGDEADKPFLLKNARILREAGEQHRAPHLLLTYCRTILQYGGKSELGEAKELLISLLKGRITELERKEASFYLASFQKTDDTSVQTDPPS